MAIVRDAHNTRTSNARSIRTKNRRKVKDARDRLVSLSHASGTDARAKLKRIRLLKKGMFELTKTSGGAVTIAKTIQGETILTTEKKRISSKKTTRTKKAKVKKSLNEAKTMMKTAKGKVSKKMSPLDMDLMDVTPKSRQRSRKAKGARPNLNISIPNSPQSDPQQNKRGDLRPHLRQSMPFGYENHDRPSINGVKILVTNLHHLVTRNDIAELFGQVGEMKAAKISSPGTAEILLMNRTDAKKAVEMYHNRELDGKAMKCYIVCGGAYQGCPSVCDVCPN